MKIAILTFEHDDVLPRMIREIGVRTVARAVGIDASHLSRLIREQGNCTPDLYRRLATAVYKIKQPDLDEGGKG